MAFREEFKEATDECPRCGNWLPPYPGAASRVTYDRSIEICSVCGTDEAMKDFGGEPPVGPDEWPVEVDEAMYELTYPQVQIHEGEVVQNERPAWKKEE